MCVCAFVRGGVGLTPPQPSTAFVFVHRKCLFIHGDNTRESDSRAMAAPSRHALAPFVGLQRLLSVDLGVRYTGLAVKVSPLLGVQRFGLLERQHAAWSLPGVAVARGGNSEWSWALQPERAGGKVSRFATQAAALWSVIDGHDIRGVVVGMPYLTSGDRSRQCDIVEATVDKLLRSWPRPVPVLLWDESWSTRLAVGFRRASAKQTARSHAAVACQLLDEAIDAAAALERHTARRSEPSDQGGPAAPEMLGAGGGGGGGGRVA